MKMLFPALSALALAAFASGCMSADEALYPSLAPRPIEVIAKAELKPAQVAQQPLDPALAARLQEVRRAVAAAGKALDAALAEAGAPSSATEPGSEQWVANQAALSRLGSAQAGLRSAETDLGGFQSALAAARVEGAATGPLEAEAGALQHEIDALLAKAGSAIDSRR